MKTERIIETDRLYLRKFIPKDATLLYKLNADQEVMKHTGDLAFENVMAARNFLLDYDDYENNKMGRWQIFTKKNDAYHGWCGLKKHSCGMVDLGYRLSRTSWGMGYATEAARASIDYGFNNLKVDVIVGRVAKENTASISVLRKLGMSYWKQGTCEGIPDAKYYRILNPNAAHII